MKKKDSGVDPKFTRQPHHHPLYECELDQAVTLEISRRSSPFALHPDRVLFREGDPPNGVFFVRKGTIQLTIQSAGQVVLSSHAQAECLLGLPSTFCDKPYSMTAEASKGAAIEHMTCQAFHDLISAHPELTFNLVQILAAEVRSVRQALADILT